MFFVFLAPSAVSLILVTFGIPTRDGVHHIPVKQEG